MSESLIIDKGRTAVLIMDYQKEIVAMLTQEQQRTVLRQAERLLNGSRQAGLPVIYVVVRFREGYPEVSPRNKSFSGIKESGRLREGREGTAIHPEVEPKKGEVVVTKRRVGAFSTTDLMSVLNARGADTLVLLGIATGGVVLSTVRWAADMDFQVVVISDACADKDEEVHRVLIEKVFPRQAKVVTAQEFLDAVAQQRA